jgi:hypothetical protein
MSVFFWTYALRRSPARKSVSGASHNRLPVRRERPAARRCRCRRYAHVRSLRSRANRDDCNNFERTWLLQATPDAVAGFSGRRLDTRVTGPRGYSAGFGARGPRLRGARSQNSVHEASGCVPAPSPATADGAFSFYNPPSACQRFMRYVSTAARSPSLSAVS